MSCTHIVPIILVVLLSNFVLTSYYGGYEDYDEQDNDFNKLWEQFKVGLLSTYRINIIGSIFNTVEIIILEIVLAIKKVFTYVGYFHHIFFKKNC